MNRRSAVALVLLTKAATDQAMAQAQAPRQTAVSIVGTRGEIISGCARELSFGGGIQLFGSPDCSAGTFLDMANSSFNNFSSTSYFNGSLFWGSINWGTSTGLFELLPSDAVIVYAA